jgi:hypothetical protein
MLNMSLQVLLCLLVIVTCILVLVMQLKVVKQEDRTPLMHLEARPYIGEVISRPLQNPVNESSNVVAIRSPVVPSRLLVSVAVYEDCSYLTWLFGHLSKLLSIDTVVVVHLNALTNYDKRELPKLNNFYYNTNRYKVRAFTGTISMAHLDNIWFATKYISREFSHVLLLSSNTVILRGGGGLEEHIFYHEASDRLVPSWEYAVKPFPMLGDMPQGVMPHFQLLAALIDPRILEKTLGFYPVDIICQGFHEGSFMPYWVWMGFLDRLQQGGLLELYHDANFQIEHFMPQTYAYYKYRRPSEEFGSVPIVDFIWSDQHALNVTRYKEIKEGKVDGIFGMKIHGTLLRDKADSRVRNLIDLVLKR